MPLGGLPLSELEMLLRLVRDLPGFLRPRIEPNRIAAMMGHRLATRAERFLALAERAIHRHPASPYRRLLRSAGCEPGDLRALVDREGLEGALAVLARQGVWVSFDEFKGRQAIVRGSERFAVRPSDFDPPGSRPHFLSQTGGSGGVPTTVPMSLPFMNELAITHATALRAHGLSQASEIFWLAVPLIHLLRSVRAGCRPTAWFSMPPLSVKMRVAAAVLQLAGRLVGRSLPGPAPLDLTEAGRLAYWLADRRDRGEIDCVTTTASAALRVATAARETGVSLRGVSFVLLGEPVTVAKRVALEAVGARAIVLYGCMEGPAAAYGCATPQAPDDCHVFSDAYGLVQRPRPVGRSGLHVDALLLTSLLPSAPKILLNVEVGDHGTLEQRDCGCALGALGLRTHLSGIRSHEKLTGEGVTFARSRLLTVLEEVLPARFGGAAIDYQVLEDEDGAGLLRLDILVSPRVGPIDERALQRAFLAALGEPGGPDGHMAGLWARAGTVRVRRQAPIATRAGKIQPFRALRAWPRGPRAGSPRPGS